MCGHSTSSVIEVLKALSSRAEAELFLKMIGLVEVQGLPHRHRCDKCHLAIGFYKTITHSESRVEVDVGQNQNVLQYPW